ncbi:hypothetical protein BY996DRAFT_6592794 [Phakopsora pachyrhizi]|nr:hypothetical protein BY996DRAFT_6592794 [Phakopsora pachyrhizi]
MKIANCQVSSELSLSDIGPVLIECKSSDWPAPYDDLIQTDRLPLPHGLAFSSVSVAIEGIINALLGKDNCLISVADVYGSTYRYLSQAAPQLGVEVTFFRHISGPSWESKEKWRDKDVLDQDAFKSDSEIGKHQAHIIFCSEARFDP